MKIYTRAFDSALGQIKQVETEVDVAFKSSVATISDLPASNNSERDVRICLDTDHLYCYIGGVWVDQGVYDMGDLVQEKLMQWLS